MGIWSVLWFTLMTFTFGASKSIVVVKLPDIPIVQYAAGPNQLTLLTDNAVRFGYQADDQFRAERRYPNGTVEGFFAQINADGKAVRTHYIAGSQGYKSSSETIPDKFPGKQGNPVEATTVDDAMKTAEIGTKSPLSDSDNFQEYTTSFNPSSEVISEENDSIYVDAITVTES